MLIFNSISELASHREEESLAIVFMGGVDGIAIPDHDGSSLLISSRTPAPVLQRKCRDGPCIEGYVARIKEKE